MLLYYRVTLEDPDAPAMEISTACTPGWPMPSPSSPREACAASRSTCRGSASPTDRPRSTARGPAWPLLRGCGRSARARRFHLVVHDIGGLIGSSCPLPARAHRLADDPRHAPRSRHLQAPVRDTRCGATIGARVGKTPARRPLAPTCTRRALSPRPSQPRGCCRNARDVDQSAARAASGSYRRSTTVPSLAMRTSPANTRRPLQASGRGRCPARSASA